MQILAVADHRGWTVVDTGRYATFERGGRVIWVTWSVRGAVTQAGIQAVGPIRGEQKAQRVVALLQEQPSSNKENARDHD